MSGIQTPDWMDDLNDGTTQVPASPGTQGSVPTTSSIASPNTQRKAATGFVNLKNYIQANQNNNLANTITNSANNKLTSAGQNLQNSQDKFQQGIANEKSKLQGSVGEAKNAVEYIDTGAQHLIQDQTPTAVSTPKPTDTFAENYVDNIAKYNNNLAEYQKQSDEYAQKANNAAKEKLSTLKNYTYSGPKGLENEQQLVSDKSQIQDFANATGSESGRGAILQTLFGKSGNYTSGIRNLDNLLLSSNPNNLDKLHALKSQSTNFGQNLEKAKHDVISGIGETQANVDIEKAKQALQLKNLRDSLKARLEAEASGYNTQQQANTSQVDLEELKQWLPEMAGYTVGGVPSALPLVPNIGNPNANQAGLPETVYNPNAGLGLASTGNITLPVDPANPTAPLTPEAQAAQQFWVNLYKNKGFENHQKVDPNKSYTRDIAVSSGPFHNDAHYGNIGNPNSQEAFVNAEALKPLFKENYTDNTWDSINKDALLRRNVLSDVLGDSAPNGYMTPKQKQEIQVTMDDKLLTGLKETPSMAEDRYNEDFFSGGPGTTGQAALQSMTQLGYQNPLQYMKDLGLYVDSPAKYFGKDNNNAYITKYIPTKVPTYMGTGTINSSNQVRMKATYNPKTNMMDLVGSGPTEEIIDKKGNTIKTKTDPRTGTLVNASTSGPIYSNDKVGGNPVLSSEYQYKTIPLNESITGDEFLKRYAIGMNQNLNWNETQSAGLIAKKLQEKYILDRLKQLGMDRPSMKVV